MRGHAVAAALAALAFASAAAADETIVVPTRPGVTVAVTFVPASGTPRAVALLFPGGIGLASERNNFLVRERGDFAQQGLDAAVVDVPSDHSAGIDPRFRASPEAAQDIAAVATALKQRTGLPVWLIGTSNGSISAANGAAAVGLPLVAGAVLTSSVWSGGMNAVALQTIKVPVLIVHNRNDRCPSANFAGAEQAMALLGAAPAKELVAVSSTAAKSQPCEALAPHGYYGIENQVVPAVAQWVVAHAPAR